MYDISRAILNISLVITNIWIVSTFLGAFFERKKIGIVSGITWSLYTVFQLLVQYNIGSASIWTTILSIVFVLVVVFSNFYVTGKKTLFVIFFFHAIWAMIEMFVFFFMDLISVPGVKSNIIGTVVSKIIMIICVYIISSVWKKDDTGFMPVKFYLPLLFVPVGSIYIAIEEFYSMDIENNLIQSIVVISILLLFNIVIFDIYSKLVHYFAFEQEKTVCVQQIDIISRNTKEQKKIMEEFHAEKHNLVNELIVLKHNIECSDKAIVMNNLNHIINSYEVKERIAKSGNDIVDALINFKYAAAKEKGIEFSLKIFIPEELPINQCDVGVVIGNAIDNAMEAVEHCREHSKTIKIVMGVKKETFIMVIENAYEHKIKTDVKGNLLSTKKDSSRHGYGVSSIKRIAEKYNGEVVIDVKDSFFSLTVTMSL